MQGIVVLYPIFVRDMAKIAALAEKQILPNRFSFSPSEQSQTEWREEEAKHYDQFMRLALVAIASVNGCPNLAALPCDVMSSDKSEADLLARLWRELQHACRNQMMICGWKIRDEIWPRLINRSLALNIEMPDWAKPNLGRRWFDVELHDISMIYSCGVWDRVRPLPALDHVLQFWLGREYPSEANTKLYAEVNAGDPRVADAARQYVAGMTEAWLRYATDSKELV